MPALIEAIEIKRKMFFEFEGAPYHCLDVEVSKPTARGGQTLVRIKMRNLITRAVFDSGQAEDVLRVRRGALPLPRRGGVQADGPGRTDPGADQDAEPDHARGVRQ